MHLVSGARVPILEVRVESHAFELMSSTDGSSRSEIGSEVGQPSWKR